MMNSGYKRIPITQFSGLGNSTGTKEGLKHSEKLAVKSNRFIDQVIKAAKKTPGVGQYKNVVRGLDIRSS